MPNQSSIDSDNKEVGSVGGSVAIQAQHSQVDGDQLIAGRDIHFTQNNMYSSSSEERKKSEAQRQEDVLVLQHHLQTFYKQEACYLTPISNEDEKKWPIAKTYRQLAIVIKDKQERKLYTLHEINTESLSLVTSLSDAAIVLTKQGQAYFVDNGRWRRNKKDELVVVSGIDCAGLSFPPATPPTFFAGGKGNDQVQQRIINEVLKKYFDSVGRTGQLTSYELDYEGYEKRSITVEGLFNKSAKSRRVVEGAGKEVTEPSRWQRLLVTGRAGVGKSTLLQYMAYRWALTESEDQVAPLWQEEYSLVFWLPLKLLHSGDNLCHTKDATDYERLAFFISKACRLEYCDVFKGQDKQTIQRTLVQLLGEKEQKILLLVDSFDEVAHWLRDDEETAQRWFLNSLFRWQGPMIVTTRPYAQAFIPSRWKIEQLVHNEGFLAADIERYVEYYFKDTPEKSQALISTLKANVGAWGLAHVPLMARLLCFYWQTATESNEQQSSGIGAMSSLTSIMGLLVESVRVRTVSHRKRRREPVSSRRNSLTGQPLADLHYPKKTVLAEAEMAIELDTLGELAFEALKAGQNQVLSTELQQRIFKKHYASLLGTDKASTYNSASELFIAAKRLGLLQAVSKAQGERLQSNPMNCEHLFIHLLFQEYLAARYIVKHLMANQYERYILLPKKPRSNEKRPQGCYLYIDDDETYEVYAFIVNSDDDHRHINLSVIAEKEESKALGKIVWPSDNPSTVKWNGTLIKFIKLNCKKYFVNPLHSFIQANRYLPRYQHVFGFVAGIARAEEEKDEDSNVLATFFRQLDDETVSLRDLVGHYERLLKIRCLEESRRGGVPSEQERAWLKDIALWIAALLLSDNYDNNRELHHQLEESQGVFSDPIILQAFVAPLKSAAVPDSIKERIINSIMQGPKNDGLMHELVGLLGSSPSNNLFSPSTTTFFHPLREENPASSKLDHIFSIESQVNALKEQGNEHLKDNQLEKGLVCFEQAESVLCQVKEEDITSNLKELRTILQELITGVGSLKQQLSVPSISK